MSLTILDLSHSPYCIPIKAALTALGVPFEIIDVPNWDRRLVIEATNGQYYEVPVLRHDDQVIFESDSSSNDIARYVDITWGNGRLFPASLAGLQDIIVAYLDNDVEGATFRACDAHYVDSIKDLTSRVMVKRHKERKFGKGCVEQWKRDIESLRTDAALHFRRFDQMLQTRPYLLADHPVYADFLLYGIVSNYTWKGWNSLPEDCQALQAWVERIKNFRFA